MDCTNSTREWACSVRWSCSNPIYRLFSSQSCYRVLLGVCSVNGKLEILSNSHREFQDQNSRTRIRVISHQDLLHSLWILGATFADFSWPKHTFVSESHPLCCCTFPHKLSYAQSKATRKRRAKKQNSSHTLHSMDPNSWPLWTEMEEFGRRCAVLGYLCSSGTDGSCSPQSGAGRKNRVTLNSPACSLNYNFCCSHVVHSSSSWVMNEGKKIGHSPANWSSVLTSCSNIPATVYFSESRVFRRDQWKE